MKNIRNNLLNGKKFVFPEFIYNDGLNIDIKVLFSGRICNKAPATYVRKDRINFAILDLLEKEIVLLGMPVAKVATYTSKRYGSFPHFSCNMHHDWSFKFASKIVVNMFFNNKQSIWLEKKL